MTARVLLADDPSAASSDGYKIVKTGGMPVRVQEQPDALAHANLTDDLDHQRAFSASNAMANKSYAFTSDSIAQGSSGYNKKSDENTFITRPYAFDGNAPSAPNLNSKAEFANASALPRAATGFEKSYSTATADASLNQTSSFSSRSASDMNREAVLGGHAETVSASPLADKAFAGDEAESARRHLSHGKDGQIIIDALPNRPLTIDEVRDLINHGFKADTDEKPSEEPSKALNDPGYQPKPLRDAPSSGGDDKPAVPANVDDKDDPVPSPGMMSLTPPPENAQPLPQK